MSKYVLYFNLLLIFVFLFSSFYFFQNINYKISELNSTLNKLNYKIEAIEKNLNKLSRKVYENKENISLLKRKLDIKINEVNSNILELEEELSKVSKDIDKLSNSIDVLNEILTKLEVYAKSVNEWLGENTDISKFSEVTYYLEKCIGNEVNIPCIGFVNENKLEISYGEDYIYYKKRDFLTPISTILKEKRGDCEDFSLLFMAELKYSLRYSKRVKTILFGKNCYDRFIIYREGNSYWYFDDVCTKYFDNIEDVYVICGYFPNETKGHCLNLICSKKYEGEKEVWKFIKNYCHFIEPQDYGVIEDEKYLRKNFTIQYFFGDSFFCFNVENNLFCTNDLLKLKW